jgi:hypothetical protein
LSRPKITMVLYRNNYTDDKINPAMVIQI